MLTASRLDALRRLVDVYVLSPLGVLPAYQRNGIGTQLVRHAIGAADVRGVPLVFLEGSSRYYGKRGFDRADTPGSARPRFVSRHRRSRSPGCHGTRSG